MKMLLALVFACTLLSCDPKGTSTILITGEEATLPAELKGLKVYNVAYSDDGEYIKVAVLNGAVSSIQCPRGKYTEDVIMVDNSGYTRREIAIKEIIMENDSMIIARK